MSESPDQKPAEFVHIEDPLEAKNILREGCKTLASATYWTKDQAHVATGHLSVFSDEDQLFYAWAPGEFDLAQFEADMGRKGVRDVYFSVSLSRANIFFRSDYLGHDAGGLKFRHPQKIFKVQRRAHLRLPVPDGYIIKADFKDPVLPGQTVVKKVLDISAGGLALLLTEADAPFYHVGMELKQLSFTVRRKKISCDAEVRHLRPTPKDPRNPGIRMGIEFRNIRAGDAQHVASYVFEESRKFYTRYL